MPTETGSTGQAAGALGLNIRVPSLSGAKIPAEKVEAKVVVQLFGLVPSQIPEIIHPHYWIQPPTGLGEEVSQIPFGNEYLRGTAAEVLAPTNSEPCVVVVRCVIDDTNPRVCLTNLPHPWKLGHRQRNGFRGSSSDNRRRNLLT